MKTRIGLVLLVVIAAIAGFDQVLKSRKLHLENESLQQQIAQLQTENKSLSNVAAIGMMKSLTDDQFNELLKLRGEVTRLTGDLSQLKKEKMALSASNRWLENLMAGSGGSIRTNLIPRTDTYASADLQNFGLRALDDAIQTTLYALSGSDPRAFLNDISPDSTILLGVGPQMFDDCQKQLTGLSEVEISSESDYLDGHVELACELQFNDGDASGKPTLLMLSMRPNNGQWCLDSATPVSLTYVKNDQP
jgi:hypothetical protein